MALNITKRQKIDDILRGSQYKAVRRNDGGFDFLQGNKKVNVNDVARNAGIDKNRIVQSLAGAGDVYSQVALESPRLKASQIQNIANTQRNVNKLKSEVYNPVNIAKDNYEGVVKPVVSGIQQSVGNLGDIALQGGQVVEELGRNTNPLINNAKRDAQRVQSLKSTEKLRNVIKGAKTITGESLNAYKDYKPTGNVVGDTFDVAARSALTGLDAVGLIPSGRAAATLKNTVKTNALKQATEGVGTKTLPLNKLKSYEGAPDKARVAQYKKQIAAGKKIDPIIVTRDSTGKLGIEDGKHRYEAARQLGIKNIPVREVSMGKYKQVLQNGSVGLGKNSKRAVDYERPKVSLKEAARIGKAERLRADEYAKSTTPLNQKAVDFVSNNFTDDTAYFQGLDRAAAKSKGGKVRNLPASDSLDANIQAYRYAPSMMEQRYKDLGINDFAKKLSNQKDYDTYRVYRTFRTAEERAAQNLKPGENIQEAYARYTGGRAYDADRQAVIDIDSTGDKFNKLFSEEVGINQKILRDRANNPELALSAQEAEDLINKYPNYTPLSREANEDVQTFTRTGKIGSQQGANVKKLKDGSTSRPVEDPLTALMANADELVKKGQANKVANILVRDHGMKLRPMVTEADIIAKEKAIVSMGELGKDAKVVASAIRNNKNLAGQLAREIRAAENASTNAKVVLSQDPSQVTLKLANMTDNQFQRLSNNLSRQTGEYDNLLGQIDLLRKRADDIKSDRLGIIRSGDLAAFESNSNKNVLRRVVNGREEVYEVTDARLAQNLANLGGRELSQAAKVLGVPTRIFKFFTTGPGNVVGFAPIALTRDILGTILFAKAPIRSIVDPRSWVDAFKGAAKRGELFEELQKRGIAGTMVEGDRAAKSVTSDALRNQGLKRGKVFLKSPSQIGRDLENFEMGTERFSRSRIASAEYRRAFSKYSKDPSITPERAKDMAFWDAAREYREGMLNFGRGGKVTRELNAVTAYINPAVQAGNKARRTIRENPFGAAVRGGVATSLIAGAYAYSASSEYTKQLYDEISDDDKQNNIIIVPPSATRDPASGEIKGIIKIPLPQEYAVLSDAVRGMFEGAEGQDYGDIALSAIAGLTGLSTQSSNQLIGQLLPTTAKPAVENLTNYSFFTGDKLTPDYVKQAANGDKTQEVRSSTSGTAKALSRFSNGAFSPIEAENIIRGFSGGATKDLLATSDTILNKTGAVADDEVTASDPFTRISKRYSEAYGKSDAVKFFEKLDDINKSFKNQDDRAAFSLLHEKNSTPGILDSAEKAQIYLSRPDVVAKERELNTWNKANDKPTNPLFDLSDGELKKVLTYRSAKMLNAGKQTYDKNGNSLFVSLGLDEPWYDKFRTTETDFYSKVSTKTDDIDKDPETFSGKKKVMPSPILEKKLNEYYKLPSGTGERSAFLKENPDILQYWESSDGFTNSERAAIGLKPVEDESSSYKKYGSGGGGRDGSSNAYKYAVSLSAGGKAPEVEKNRVKSRKITKAAVSTAGKTKPKVSIKKSLV